LITSVSLSKEELNLVSLFYIKSIEIKKIGDIDSRDNNDYVIVILTSIVDSFHRRIQ
jgi:hypothetical protein